MAAHRNPVKRQQKRFPTRPFFLTGVWNSSYCLQKPSGEVTGLVTAAKASAEAAAAQAETDPAEEESAPAEGGEETNAQAAAAETELEYPTE